MSAADAPVEFVDPRTLYPRPPFPEQTQPRPGSDAEMEPKADHGEDSYRGSGKLTGAVAIVTGGDSGIGRAVAIAYAREGADVVVAYWKEADDAEKTAGYVRDAGRKALLFEGDLRDEAKCKELIEKTVSELGKLDILVNNAARQTSIASIDSFDSEEFDAIYKTNVYAPFYLMKHAIGHLPPGGSIINTTSIQAFRPTDMITIYSSTKSALTGLTKGFAKLAMKAKGVRINAVAPGPVWTPFIPQSMGADATSNFGSGSLFGRPAQPAEQAPLFVWLASPEASYVTGETFGATGGSMPL